VAIKFKNTRSGEIVVADSEPKIAAFLNSSNIGPNAMGGQDFGWKLAPEVLVELKRLRRDPATIQQIANNMSKTFNEINDIDLLKYISDRTDIDRAPVAMDDDFEDEYEAEVRHLEGKNKLKPNTDRGESVDMRLEDARIEAGELGLDISSYGDNLGLIRGAITRAKNKLAN